MTRIHGSKVSFSRHLTRRAKVQGVLRWVQVARKDLINGYSRCKFPNCVLAYLRLAERGAILLFRLHGELES